MLKNVFTWILIAAVALALAVHVVRRPHPVAPPAVVEVAPAPSTYTEFREAHEPPEPAPVAKPEPAKVAHEAKPARHKSGAAKAAKRAATSVRVKPDNGGNAVSVPCPRLKGYVDSFGRDRVKTGAQNYGYSEDDAERALKACGL